MKKAIILFIVVALVSVTTILWLFTSHETLKSFDFLSFGVIFLVVGFAVFFGYKRLTSAKRGEPAEDELSKKILLKTAATSYYVSLYMWLGIMFIKERVNLDTDELFGAGILGMALILCNLLAHFPLQRYQK